MVSSVPDEYEIDPGTDIDRLAALFRDEYPDAVAHDVTEAIFVDDGPIDYLAWLALDGYDRHEFFYYDSDPDSDVLQQLLMWSPDQQEMRLLKAFFAKQYDTVKEIEAATFIEVPDPYLPGTKPSANIAFYQNPVDDVVNVGLNATPLQREEEILSDVDRVVPAKDLETFARNIINRFYDDIEAEAERHELEGDVQSVLEDDPGFHHQTTKAIPDDVHPVYAGEPAQLWQKSISKVDTVDGSQGFVQVWVPEEHDDVGFVSVTNGAYDPEQALHDVRSQLKSRLE
ncbi:hypothetical protein [Halomicrobium urmianum]|uniref:hypothetical protein n=1 Tax=Halomicrobium urmianum TaxID=1586233 RepID=UPI001CD947E6|nr:hypothetical protein [Halomicrobium urmianum]